MSSDHQRVHSSNSNEWFTPVPIIEAARQLMGGIDLDPASCAEANQRIRAGTYFDELENGLWVKNITGQVFPRHWYGKVFLNPPYGWNEHHESNQDVWSSRLIGEYNTGHTTEAVLLVNAQTAEQWFQPLWKYPICFTSKRLKFDLPTGMKRKNGPTHGNAIVYFGPPEKYVTFRRLFSQFGPVVVAIGLTDYVDVRLSMTRWG